MRLYKRNAMLAEAQALFEVVLFGPIYIPLKGAKCEIFDRSDFHDFYPIKSLWEGDFGAKI